ncbi:hypothetical protein [Spirosoma luteolum]
MKTPVTSGLLVRSLLVASFSSLVACSSALQAHRLRRSFPKQLAEIVAGVSPEAGSEPVSFMDERQQLDSELTYSSPRSILSGYRWIFIGKKGAPNNTGPGNWVVTSHQ